MRAARILVLLALLVPRIGASAQSIQGTVFDSTAGVPLERAQIQVMSADDPAGPLAGRAVSDRTGRYRVDGLRPGRYLASFFHPSLEQLGIDAPLRAVELGTGVATLDLAIPGQAVVYAALCAAGEPADSGGGIVGIMRDAATRAGTGGTAIARWMDLVFGPSGVRRPVHTRTAPADPLTGRFLVCGVPGEVEVALRAVHDTDSTGWIPVVVPRRGVVRRDIWITAGGGFRGGRVEGRIESSRGAPIAGARIAVAGTAAATTSDSAGRYTLAAAPGGSQTLIIRALGYMPVQRVVDLIGDSTARVDVSLATIASVLDTVRVVAARLYDADRTGFERRRRSGMGSFFGSDDVARLRPVQLSDLLRRMPAVRLEDGPGGTRTVRMRGEQSSCTPVIFLDGQLLSGLDLSDVDRFVPPSDIDAMEVYTKELAPAQFTTLEECGSIVIWTKGARGTRRR